MINSTIAQYKVLRLIGEGGMASVYEAEQESIKKKVAIKVLNPYLSGNAQFRERFRKEAELMAQLKNPNITSVIAYDEHPVSYIIMEYLEGEDLRERIKRKGRLDDEEIKFLFTQILNAFQYAHENGIVHRDIKPANIFILKNDQVKILDFGIAKIFGQGDEFTQTGTQMGTTVYMSPEQVKADRSIDFRSDIYSLGITMYYAINGKPPYDTENISQFDIFNKIVHETLPQTGFNSNYYDTILRACEKDREDRYQSCNEWLRDIENIASGRIDKTRIQKKKTSSRSPQKVILSLLLNAIEVVGIIAGLFSFFASVILFISEVLADHNEYIGYIGEWFNVALVLGVIFNFTAVIYYLVNKNRFYSPAIFLIVSLLSFFIKAGYFYSLVESFIR
jgi:serine/threonine protein kinase